MKFSIVKSTVLTLALVGSTTAAEINLRGAVTAAFDKTNFLVKEDDVYDDDDVIIYNDDDNYDEYDTVSHSAVNRGDIDVAVSCRLSFDLILLFITSNFSIMYSSHISCADRKEYPRCSP